MAINETRLRVTELDFDNIKDNLKTFLSKLVRKQGQKNEAISKLPLNLLLHFSRFTPFPRDYFLRSGLLASKRSLKSSPHFTYLVALRHWNQVQLARALYHQLST